MSKYITKNNYSDIYNWLLGEKVLFWSRNNYWVHLDSEHNIANLSFENNKINVEGSVEIAHSLIKKIEYPFGVVSDNFFIQNCKKLKSLIGFPKKVGGEMGILNCFNILSLKGLPKQVGDLHFLKNEFSNNPSEKEGYKLYLAMWLELLESVSNDDRTEYIKNYKDKKDTRNYHSIIPIEIMKEYGF